MIWAALSGRPASDELKRNPVDNFRRVEGRILDVPSGEPVRRHRVDSLHADQGTRRLIDQNLLTDGKDGVIDAKRSGRDSVHLHRCIHEGETRNQQHRFVERGPNVGWRGPISELRLQRSEALRVVLRRGRVEIGDVVVEERLRVTGQRRIRRLGSGHLADHHFGILEPPDHSRGVNFRRLLLQPTGGGGF
ncbi:hypothetical protein ACFPRL_21980 [Pseudoclavibacter helvolus]